MIVLRTLWRIAQERSYRATMHMAILVMAFRVTQIMYWLISLQLFLLTLGRYKFCYGTMRGGSLSGQRCGMLFLLEHQLFSLLVVVVVMVE